MEKLIIIYTTVPSHEKAQEISKHLLEKRLIACAVTVEAQSMYWWQGDIAQDNEVVVIAKTLAEKFALIEKEILSIHPYQVPCIIKIDITANDAYANWVAHEVNKK
jgi:periplasmic divalent cation tolerance protein